MKGLMGAVIVLYSSLLTGASSGGEGRMVNAYCRRVFHGSPVCPLPDIVRTYTVGPEARYIYISGWNFYVRQIDFALAQTPTLWIYDCLTDRSMKIDVDCETFGNIVDLYSLNVDEIVVVTFDEPLGVLTQNLLLIDRATGTSKCEFMRNWKFNGQQKSTKISPGGTSSRYIVVAGTTSAELGEVLMVRLIPADPRSTTYPQIDLDSQICRLETLVKRHPNEIFIWPLATIMINERGVYIPLARKRGQTLTFDASLIGAVEFMGEGNFDVKLIDVDCSCLCGMCERDLSVNFVSMIAQRNHSAWITSIVPKPPHHWRWKLQRIAVSICRFLLLYFGTFTLWLSSFDGGYSAFWFGRFYLWLLGGRVNPNLGPRPAFYMYALDMNAWRISKRLFKADIEWLHAGGQVMIDANDGGGIVMAEVSRECDHMTVTKFPDPFLPEALSLQALHRCHQLYPRLRYRPALCREWGIIDYTAY